jgi:hypothetical protein
METPWKWLAEQLVHARSATDEDATHVLEWVATREGKSVPALVKELRRHAGAREPAYPPRF